MRKSSVSKMNHQIRLCDILHLTYEIEGVDWDVSDSDWVTTLMLKKYVTFLRIVNRIFFWKKCTIHSYTIYTFSLSGTLSEGDEVEEVFKTCI